MTAHVASTTPGEISASFTVGAAKAAIQKTVEALSAGPKIIDNRQSPHTAPADAAPADAAPAMSNEEILAMVARSRYSHHTNLDDALKSDKANQIIMGYDGLYIRRKEEFNGNTITITTKTDKAPGLRNPLSTIECTVTNRIPGRLFKEMVAWFRAVYEMHKTESAAQIYRHGETKEYFVYYPKQRVAAANVDYKEDMDAAVNLRQKHTLVLEAHSHPWGTAGGKSWFSGGDDANEKFACFYLVVGSVMGDEVAYGARMKLMDLQKALELHEIFDFEGIENPFSTKDIPTVAPQLFDKISIGIPYSRPTVNAGYNTNYNVNGYAYGNSVYTGQTAAELAEMRRRRGQGIYGLPAPGASSFNSKAYQDSFKHPALKQYHGAAGSSPSAILNSSNYIDFEWLVDSMTMEECIALTEVLADKLEGRKK